MTTLRLGVVNYLNALPVHYSIIKGLFHLPCELVYGTPVELNQKISKGDIDISLVSSFEYALHSSQYYVFPQLSISADGPVRSIYLFTKSPLESLEGRIYLTSHSHTSLHLVQYLLKEHNTTYIFGERPDVSEIDGEMLIGDEAIRCFYNPRFPHVYDLSELWKQRTGLPFVFAVWIVRREIFEKYSDTVREICQTLGDSRDTGKTAYQQMAQEYYQGVFPKVEDCVRYLTNLRYDLTPLFQEGFLRFQECCLEMGFLEKVSPLEFVP